MNKDTISFWLLIIPFSSIFFGLHLTPVLSQCLDDQKSSLLDLKNSLKFDSSHSVKLVAWNQTVDCCQWLGILCDKSGYVISLDLNNETINGIIDDSSSLFSLRFLEILNLANNRLSGQISEFVISCYKLPNLSTISLSTNKFTGSVDLDMFGKFKDLYSLDLSNNEFSVTIKSNNSAFSSLSRLNSLKLASCKMQKLPDLKNQTRLMQLDLSKNDLSGQIPNWIWEIGNGYLRFLNLSNNGFSSLEKPYTFPFLLDVLDLHSNHLKGNIPIPPRRVYILDYSNNKFEYSIPFDFGNVLTSTLFFSIANNKLSGVIPESICNASNLQVLDLSNNSLNGIIPSCLSQTNKNPEETCDVSVNDDIKKPVSKSLKNCEKNKILDLDDKVTNDFPRNRFQMLKVVNFSHNLLTGRVPMSIGSLKNLESLDLSSNMLNGSIPEELTSLGLLSFLNLSYNHLTGRIPQGSRFQMFTDLSFQGNEGLCGPPLKKSCDHNNDNVKY